MSVLFDVLVTVFFIYIVWKMFRTASLVEKMHDKMFDGEEVHE